MTGGLICGVIHMLKSGGVTGQQTGGRQQDWIGLAETRWHLRKRLEARRAVRPGHDPPGLAKVNGQAVRI